MKRRDLLRSGVALTAPSLLAGCTTDRDPPTVDWPTRGFDAANSGYHGGLDGPKPPVRTRWRANPDEARRTSSPIVVDSTVYALVEFAPRQKLSYGAVVAFNVANGREMWRTPLVAAVNDGGDYLTDDALTYADGTLYAGSADGLHAVETEHGVELWAYETEDVVRRSPRVADGTAYFSDRNRVYAVDAESGKERWRYRHPDGAFTVAVGEKAVYATGESLVALAAADGTERWRAKRRYPNYPTVVDGLVYAVRGVQSLDALDASTGEKRWTFDPDGKFNWSSQSVGGGAVFVGSTEGEMYALDAATGETNWTFTLSEDAEGRIVYGAPAVTDEALYFGCSDGALYAVDTDSGNQQWRHETESGMAGGTMPAVVEGAAVFSMGDSLMSIDHCSVEVGKYCLR